MISIRKFNIIICVVDAKGIEKASKNSGFGVRLDPFNHFATTLLAIEFRL